MESVIDKYISAISEDIRPIFVKLKEEITNAVPQATEKIAWGMPTFYLNGNLVHFAANKNHLGIYPGALAIEVFKDRLTDYKFSKGAIQFPYSKPIPYNLIIDIVLFNAKNIK